MFRPRVFAIAAVAVSALSLGSGCATVVRGFSVPKVEVTSSPSGARVFVDGEEAGQTPLTLKRLGWGNHRLRMEPPEGVAADPRSIRISKEFNSPATWELAFIGVWGIGLPGFLVDWCAGTAYEYTIEDWHVSFVKPKPVRSQAMRTPPATPGPAAIPATGAPDAVQAAAAPPPPDEDSFFQPQPADEDASSIDALLDGILQSSIPPRTAPK